MRWFDLSFAPMKKVSRTICALVSLEASTRVSPDFALLTVRSPSFQTHGGKEVTFHDDCFSKPLTFHNGFMFLLLLASVSSTFRDFKLHLFYKSSTA